MEDTQAIMTMELRHDEKSLGRMEGVRRPRAFTMMHDAWALDQVKPVVIAGQSKNEQDSPKWLEKRMNDLLTTGLFIFAYCMTVRGYDLHTVEWVERSNTKYSSIWADVLREVEGTQLRWRQNAKKRSQRPNPSSILAI